MRSSSFAVLVLLVLIVAVGILAFLGQSTRHDIAQRSALPPPLWSPR